MLGKVDAEAKECSDEENLEDVGGCSENDEETDGEEEEEEDDDDDDEDGDDGEGEQGRRVGEESAISDFKEETQPISNISGDGSEDRFGATAVSISSRMRSGATRNTVEESSNRALVEAREARLRAMYEAVRTEYRTESREYDKEVQLDDHEDLMTLNYHAAAEPKDGRASARTNSFSHWQVSERKY